MDSYGQSLLRLLKGNKASKYEDALLLMGREIREPFSYPLHHGVQPCLTMIYKVSVLKDRQNWQLHLILKLTGVHMVLKFQNVMRSLQYQSGFECRLTAQKERVRISVGAMAFTNHSCP